MRGSAAYLGAPPGSSFEVFGVDMLVDTDYRPWLVEINAVPSLARKVPPQSLALPPYPSAHITLLSNPLLPSPNPYHDAQQYHVLLAGPCCKGYLVTCPDLCKLVEGPHPIRTTMGTWLYGYLNVCRCGHGHIDPWISGNAVHIIASALTWERVPEW